MAIRGLRVRCILGARDAERLREREVVISLVLRGDFSAAGRSDDLADAVDYSVLCEGVRSLARRSRYRLVEALAEAVAATCLTDARIASVTVTVEKPGALADSDSVAVSITRTRPGPETRACGEAER
jgi:dihydroneopterin aldolase